MDKNQWLAEKRADQERNGDAMSTEQPTTRTVEIAPAITPPGQQLTEAERLGIENIYLQMRNCQLQVEQCDALKEKIIGQMRQLQTDMEEKRRMLSEKYAVDITSATVTPTGVIIPPATNGAHPGT
jgi:hypothetical protein